jgi:hypothetical protein
MFFSRPFLGAFTLKVAFEPNSCGESLPEQINLSLQNTQVTLLLRATIGFHGIAISVTC